GVFSASLVSRFGMFEPCLTSAGGILAQILGSGAFLVNVEVRWRKHSLEKVFLATISSAAATERGNQQQKSAEHSPDSERACSDRIGWQGQPLDNSEGI